MKFEIFKDNFNLKFKETSIDCRRFLKLSNHPQLHACKIKSLKEPQKNKFIVKVLSFSILYFSLSQMKNLNNRCPTAFQVNFLFV